MDIRFGTENVRSLYRAGSMRTAESKLAKYNLDLEAVQEVRQNKGGYQPADDYTFFHGNRDADHHLGTVFLYIWESHQQLKRVEFIGDRMLYIKLRGCWCDIILNVYAPTEDKTENMKDSFYKELQCVFDQFLKYHVKILLGDLNAKVGGEDIFKPTIWNESLHE
jgi:hypothetical protein